MFVAHPRLRPDAVEDRPYQKALADRIQEAPHLVVLPTGLGKTVVALRAILPHLDGDSQKRILVLSPTKPLCDQHARFFRGVLLDVPVAVFTGDTSPTDRVEAWKSARIIVATPQVVQNDLVRGATDLSDVGFVVYDEAHRATGRYPYVFIARRYRAAGGLAACGLTASPGNDGAALQEVLQNLLLQRVEVRTDRDADIAPYVHEVATEWVRVRPTPAARQVVRLLERMYGRTVVSLRRLGHLSGLGGLPTRKDVLRLGQVLRAQLSSGAGRSHYEAVSLQARALKLQHALELAETQGSAPAYQFLRRVEQEAASTGGSKAARDLVREPEFLEALSLARDDAEPPPKQVALVERVRAGFEKGQRRILIFAHYRETADQLVAALGREAGVRISRFVGHAATGGERGMTRREQEAVVERFRSGDLNVLVATAVGEEGLDLPEVDAVLLHEPVPSAIRFVQRRGRTGRRAPGQLTVLLMEGTRDESYHWSALRRERKMNESLGTLRLLTKWSTPQPVAAAVSSAPPQAALAVPAVEITIDTRESGSAVARALIERGVRLRTTSLPTGDFAIGEGILVERKSAADFAASVRDGRLLDQLPRLAQARHGILLIEGDPYKAESGLSPAAISGAMAAALLHHRVNVVVLSDAERAADFLASLARRSLGDSRERPLRIEKAPRNPDGQIRFVLEGLPHVGPVTARHLLERFGSLAAVAAASPEDLAETSGVGLETARRVHELLHRRYAAPASVAPLGNPQGAVAALEGSDGPAG